MSSINSHCCSVELLQEALEMKYLRCSYVSPYSKIQTTKKLLRNYFLWMLLQYSSRSCKGRLFVLDCLGDCSRLLNRLSYTLVMSLSGQERWVLEQTIMALIFPDEQVWQSENRLAKFMLRRSAVLRKIYNETLEESGAAHLKAKASTVSSKTKMFCNFAQQSYLRIVNRPNGDFAIHLV